MTRSNLIAYYRESYLEQVYFRLLLFMMSWRQCLGRAILQKFSFGSETDVQILFSQQNSLKVFDKHNPLMTK